MFTAVQYDQDNKWNRMKGAGGFQHVWTFYIMRKLIEQHGSEPQLESMQCNEADVSLTLLS